MGTVLRKTTTTLPGLATCLLIATASTLIGRAIPFIGAAVPALVIGVVAAAVRQPSQRLKPGIAFSSKFVLQLSVVLLGGQLSLAHIATVGEESLPIMITTLVGCLSVAWLLTKWMRIPGRLGTLIGVGTGVCGASAIAAVAPVIRASAAEITYAVSTIFTFNVAAVLTFPFIGHAMGLDQQQFGLFAGTAVNDTSSVVATAAIYGTVALNYAVVVKLVRTLSIIPITVTLAVRDARRHRRTTHRLGVRQVVGLVPWFLVGFLLLALLNSVNVIPTAFHPGLQSVAVFMIAVAMAGIGLSTDVASLRTTGVKPMALGAILWVVVAAISLATIQITSMVVGGS